MMIERSTRTRVVGNELPDEDSDELPRRGTTKFVHSSAPLDARFYSEDLRRTGLLHGYLEECGEVRFDGEVWLR